MRQAAPNRLRGGEEIAPVIHRLRRISLLSATAFSALLVLCTAATADAPDPCRDLQHRYEIGKPSMTETEVSLILFASADAGCPALTASLLDAGASVDARDRFGARPLSHAARAGHLALVQLLLARGAPIDARNLAGATALYAAIETSRSDVARLLIERGANVKLTGRSDLSPLAVAAFNRDDALVALLLAKGASPAAVDKADKTPIVYATARGALPVVERLLGRGIDVNTRYGNDLTLLMWAAGYDDTTAAAEGVKVATLLLDRGAHVDDRDNRGRTALMIAAEQGHADMVELLLSRGADSHAKDNAGKMAADLTAQTALRERLLRP